MSIGNKIGNDKRHKALVEETKIGNNYKYWIIMAWLSLILMGIMFLPIA